METRYQVFVSSTYTDLIEERRAVMQSLLTMDCIPAGMELFPAADETVWGLIESVIKESDYYVLILGGRYGSGSKDNPLSFTEREYRLAIKLKVPVLAFLHGDPGKIPQEKTDVKDTARDALRRFRQEVTEAHHVNFWMTPHELAAKTMLAIQRATKTTPRVGWIRADQAMDVRTVRELERLRRENEELRAKFSDSTADMLIGTSELAPDHEFVPGDIVIRFKKDAPTAKRPGSDVRPETVLTRPFGMTWRHVFAIVGAKALEGMSEYQVEYSLRETLEIRIRAEFAGLEMHDMRIDIPDEVQGRIKTQFLALGWLKLERPANSRGYTKWWLTPLGRTQLVSVLAVRHSADGDMSRPKPQRKKTRVGRTPP